MHKVLFLNDLSKNASVAFQYAAFIASANSAILSQASCNAQSLLPLHRAPEDAGRIVRELEDFAVQQGFGGEAEYLDSWVENAESACRLAEHIRAGIIIMPESEPYSAGIAQRLARISSIPLLLVPASAKFRPVQKIVFAVSFQFNDLIALNMLRRWVQLLNARLDIIHILEDGQQAHEAAEKMGAIAEILNGGRTYAFQLLTDGQPGRAILEYLQRTGADMLALTTHRRSAWEAFFDKSTSNRLLKECEVPLLLIKDFEGS